MQAFGGVTAGQPVVMLNEQGAGRAGLLVRYAVASRLTAGQAVSVVPTDGDRLPLPATVAEIARLVPVVVGFHGAPPDLPWGMAVEVVAGFVGPLAARGIPLPQAALARQRPAALDDPEDRHADASSRCR